MFFYSTTTEQSKGIPHMLNVESQGGKASDSASSHSREQQYVVDVGEFFRLLAYGWVQTIGLGLLGTVVAALIFLAVGQFTLTTTSTRVEFSFPGLSNNQYPNGDKFSPNDLTAPDVVAAALKEHGFDTSPEFLTQIRSALDIVGIIPLDIVKARDRARSMGLTPPKYIPDEYILSLSLPRRSAISGQRRITLLNGLIDAYREKFQRTYADVPFGIGGVFDSLQNADYFEYELILNEEMGKIFAYLNQKVAEAKNFRSPSTNLSFADLYSEATVFSQIRLNETLGLIREYGLSKNRPLQLIKMDYYLSKLQDSEQKALEEEKTVRDLLSKSQEHAQNYVLGIKSQFAQPQSETPIVDKGLIDTLLANDSYNFLVRKALDAGLEVKRIQANKAQLLEQRKILEDKLNAPQSNQSKVIIQIDESLVALRAAYDRLIKDIQVTQADYSRQQYNDVIIASDSIHIDGTLRPLAEAAAVGMLLGAGLGMALSLLGVYLPRRKGQA